MSWIFRKIFRFGPFRATLSKEGVGTSWGIPGFRVGVSSNGRKYITIGIPGTGIYFTKFFNQQEQLSNNKPTQLPFQQNKSQIIKKEEPWWKQKHL